MYISNTLKKQEQWWVSFHILPSLSIYRNIENGAVSLFFAWFNLSIQWVIKKSHKEFIQGIAK